MRRWLMTVGAVVVVGVCGLSIGCASFPPRLSDGTLDLDRLVTWASDGIEADCAIGFNLDVCTFGRQTIADAHTDMAADPAHPARALSLSLTRSALKWPVVAPYVQFVRNVL